MDIRSSLDVPGGISMFGQSLGILQGDQRILSCVILLVTHILLDSATSEQAKLKSTFRGLDDLLFPGAWLLSNVIIKCRTRKI